jgi:hypothetical protein
MPAWLQAINAGYCIGWRSWIEGYHTSAQVRWPAAGLASGKTGGPGKHRQGQGIDLIGWVEPVIAERRAARHMLLMAAGRATGGRHRAMLEQIGAPQLRQIGTRPAERLVPIAGEIAAGQVQGQGQIAELLGNGCEIPVVPG